MTDCDYENYHEDEETFESDFSDSRIHTGGTLLLGQHDVVKDRAGNEVCGAESVYCKSIGISYEDKLSHGIAVPIASGDAPWKQPRASLMQTNPRGVPRNYACAICSGNWVNGEKGHLFDPRMEDIRDAKKKGIALSDAEEEKLAAYDRKISGAIDLHKGTHVQTFHSAVLQFEDSGVPTQVAVKMAVKKIRDGPFADLVTCRSISCLRAAKRVLVNLDDDAGDEAHDPNSKGHNNKARREGVEYLVEDVIEPARQLFIREYLTARDFEEMIKHDVIHSEWLKQREGQLLVISSLVKSLRGDGLGRGFFPEDGIGGNIDRYDQYISMVVPNIVSYLTACIFKTVKPSTSLQAYTSSVFNNTMTNPRNVATLSATDLHALAVSESEAAADRFKKRYSLKQTLDSTRFVRHMCLDNESCFELLSNAGNQAVAPLFFIQWEEMLPRLRELHPGVPDSQLPARVCCLEDSKQMWNVKTISKALGNKINMCSKMEFHFKSAVSERNIRSDVSTMFSIGAQHSRQMKAQVVGEISHWAEPHNYGLSYFNPDKSRALSNRKGHIIKVWETVTQIYRWHSRFAGLFVDTTIASRTLHLVSDSGLPFTVNRGNPIALPSHPLVVEDATRMRSARQRITDRHASRIDAIALGRKASGTKRMLQSIVDSKPRKDRVCTIGIVLPDTSEPILQFKAALETVAMQSIKPAFEALRSELYKGALKPASESAHEDARAFVETIRSANCYDALSPEFTSGMKTEFKRLRNVICNPVLRKEAFLSVTREAEDRVEEIWAILSSSDARAPQAILSSNVADESAMLADWGSESSLHKMEESLKARAVEQYESSCKNVPYEDYVMLRGVEQFRHERPNAYAKERGNFAQQHYAKFKRKASARIRRLRVYMNSKLKKPEKKLEVLFEINGIRNSILAYKKRMKKFKCGKPDSKMDAEFGSMLVSKHGTSAQKRAIQRLRRDSDAHGELANEVDMGTAAVVDCREVAPVDDDGFKSSYFHEDDATDLSSGSESDEEV